MDKRLHQAGRLFFEQIEDSIRGDEVNDVVSFHIQNIADLYIHIRKASFSLANHILGKIDTGIRHVRVAFIEVS